MDARDGCGERMVFCAHAVSIHLLGLRRTGAVVHFTSCRPCGDGPRPEVRVALDHDALVLLRASADHALAEMAAVDVATPDGVRDLPRASGG